jgi:hypothetical protein
MRSLNTRRHTYLEQDEDPEFSHRGDSSINMVAIGTVR